MLSVRKKKEERWAADYPLKQRVFEALAPGTVPGHPAPTGLAASACCSEIVTATVTTTTPSNPNATTMAIITVDVVDRPSCDEPARLLINQKKLFHLSIFYE